MYSLSNTTNSKLQTERRMSYICRLRTWNCKLHTTISIPKKKSCLCEAHSRPSKYNTTL